MEACNSVTAIKGVNLAASPSNRTLYYVVLVGGVGLALFATRYLPKLLTSGPTTQTADASPGQAKEALKTEAQLLQEEVDALKAHKSSLKADLSQLSAQKASAQKDCDDISAEVDALKPQKASLEVDISQLSALQVSIQWACDNLSTEFDALRASKSRLLSENKQLATQKESILRDCKDLSAKRSARGAQLRGLRFRKSTMSSEIDHLAKEKALAEEVLAGLEAKLVTQRATLLKSQANEMQSENEKLEQKQGSIREENARLSAIQADLLSFNAGLKKEIVQAQESRDKLLREAAALEALAAKKIPPRIIGLNEALGLFQTAFFLYEGSAAQRQPLFHWHVRPSDGPVEAAIYALADDHGFCKYALPNLLDSYTGALLESLQRCLARGADMQCWRWTLENGQRVYRPMALTPGKEPRSP